VILEPWSFFLLALAAFRVTYFLTDDSVFDTPRAWISGLHPFFKELVTCFWCLGFWVSAAWWLCWYVFPHGTIVASEVWAIATVVGLLGHWLSD
jgi:Protein of unknown function (DUF1360)